jgi:hypothetical protein
MCCAVLCCVHASRSTLLDCAGGMQCFLCLAAPLVQQ